MKAVLEDCPLARKDLADLQEAVKLDLKQVRYNTYQEQYTMWLDYIDFKGKYGHCF